MLQVIDCTFTQPTDPYASAVTKAPTASDGNDGAFPALFSNTTVSDEHNVLNISRELGQPDVTIAATGKCQATGITSGTNFFKSLWPVPGKVIDVTDSQFGLPAGTLGENGSVYFLHGVMTYPDATAAVQATINAAAAIPGAIAYFPTGNLSRGYGINCLLSFGSKCCIPIPRSRYLCYQRNHRDARRNESLLHRRHARSISV